MNATAALPRADATRYRFALAWLMPLTVAAGAWWSPWAAWGVTFGWQAALALAERQPGWADSPPAAAATPWHRFCLLMHLPLQAGLLALGLWLVATGDLSAWAVVALGIGVGGVSGGQGITFAHELGHSRSRLERLLAWALMTSVLYAHFMVEHYRGHHVRAATRDDPASARYGESLWRFLPRSFAGSLVSAWRLEARWLAQLRRGWATSPLAWATGVQLAWLAALWLAIGPLGVLFWVIQAGYAAFLLETTNYIEHYGLERGMQGGRREPFGPGHAWNAEHLLTNSVVANLQRHSDHHMHAWKPYPELEPLPGPQLPTGYAGCLFLASVPPLWFSTMHPRIAAFAAARA